MKKLSIMLIAIAALISGVSYAIANYPDGREDIVRLPSTKQGVSSSSTPDKRKAKPGMRYDWYIPDDMPAPDGEFTMDMIKFWAGEGENKAALVIQWNDDKEKNALVFGYRWDGLATGADMIKAVVAAYPRLYTLIQYTNVSSPTDPLGGYTINGFGWDTDNDGDIGLIDTKDNQEYRTPNGVFIHPRGYDPDKGGSSDYDYDDWVAVDKDDLWGAGWYLSYWSYWVKDDYKSMFSYSGWGASGRVLQDGSWDGWNFSLDMIPRDWKEFVAAPALIPEGAKTEFEYQGLCYRLLDYSNKTVALAAPKEGAASYSGNITVPATFVDEDITYNVTQVADYAFDGMTDVTAVDLPMSVTNIGKYAFRNTGISKLTVNGQSESYENIGKIGTGAFASIKSLDTPVFSSKVTAVSDSCFYEAGKITTINFPDYVTTVGSESFGKCTSLKTIEIPATIKSVGVRTFGDCNALTDVYCGSTSPLPIEDDTFGDVAEITLHIPFGFENDYKNATGWKKFGKIQQQLIEVHNGDIFKYNGMTYRVTSVGTENTVTATYCKFDGKPSRDLISTANKAGYTGNITIPTKVSYQEKDFTVTALNDSAFYGASELQKVDIKASVNAVGAYVFYDCKALGEVILPASLTEIGQYAFSYSGITSLDIPEGVTALGDRAFFQTPSLSKVSLPSTLTKVGNNCFAYATALEAISLGDNITTLGTTLFQNCQKLKSVKFPASATKIPSYCFQNCSALTSFEFPANITEISSSAFKGCTSLKIELPSTVTTIGSEAFSNCLQLTEFHFPENMTAIPNYVLDGCENLTSITMGKNVTSIGNYAFRKCVAIKKFDLPDGVKSIGNYAFANCSIDSIVVPSACTSIGTYAFSSNPNLKYVRLPEGIKTLGASAFRSTGLKELVVPSGPTSISATDIVNGCSDITIYSCAISPVTVGTYTWRTSTNKWAQVVVPTGTKALYAAKNYWSKSEISEVAPNGISVKDVVTTSEDNTTILKGNVDLTYGKDMPLQFLEANNRYLIGKSAATISYGNEEKEIVIEASTGNFNISIPSGVTEAVLKLNYDAENTLVSETFAVPQPAAPSVVNSFVDFEKIEYNVGEGPLHCALLVSWNDAMRGVDHLVWGVNFTPGETAEQIIAKVANADSRFYALESGYGYDNLDKGTLSEKYDHYSLDAQDLKWHITSDKNLNSGSVVYLEYTSSEEPVKPEYLFYIPSAEKLGAWIPASYKLPIADDMALPVWVRGGAYGAKDVTVTMNPSRPYVVTTSATNNFRDGCAMVAVTPATERFVQSDPKCYDMTIKLSVSTRNSEPEGMDNLYWLDNKQTFDCSIVAPVKPITKIKDNMINVAGQLKATSLKDLVEYEPADATYTGFRVYEVDMNTYETGKKINPYYEDLDNGAYEFWLNAITVNSGANDRIFVIKSILDEKIEGLLGFTINPNPVTSVYLEGIEGNTLDLEVNEIAALRTRVEPSDAVSRGVALSIENATVENMANAYSVGGSEKFTELVTYRPGEFDLVLKSVENPDVKKTYHVTVRDYEKVVANDYTDGTFWLNEEWFTHKNGSINYLTSPLIESDNEIIYRAYARQNEDKGFGATSQYGMIFGDKLFIMSKQEHDQGDIRGKVGGRLVVANAKTLKTLAEFDEIGGDGRACLGVTPEKAYIGSHAGIRVLHFEDGVFTLESSGIKGIGNDTQSGSSDIGNNQALYNKQVGDMVLAGKYAYAIQQGVGVHIIDIDTDTLVRTIGDTGVQGIVQDGSGNVWFASTAGITESGTTLLHEIDYLTGEEIRTVTVPGTIGCSWGSWRSTNFFAGLNDRILYWNGASSGITSSGSVIYKWDIDADPQAENIKPFFTLPTQQGVTSDVTRVMYATMRLDHRNNSILFATTTAPSGNYRYNWYNFIDASNGDILSQVRLKDYYWFPALPIFPDAHAPEIAAIDPISIKIPLTATESRVTASYNPVEFRINATDKDNNDHNIGYRILNAEDLEDIAEVSLDGNKVTITPKKAGNGNLTLMAHSNGVPSIVDVPLNIANDILDGVAEIADGDISINGRRVRVRNLDGTDFMIYDMSGKPAAAFTAAGDDCSVYLGLDSGTYVLIDNSGKRKVKFIIM